MKVGLAVFVVALAAFPIAAGSAPTIDGCPVFPDNNAWNKRVDKLPRSAKNRDNALVHPDFGSNPDYGIPFVVAPADQKKVPIRFTAYGDESDPGPYPIPANAPVEVGGDHHVLVVQSGACKLYELYNAQRSGSGWDADQGSIFDLRSNALRPAGWTSADAAGLPIFPGLARYDEVKSGKITHALRVTVAESQRGYISPARHFASDSRNSALPPMGLRLRLKKSFDTSKFHGDSKVILTALRRYGMIVADNGSSWFISGATDTRWDDDDLNQLKSVPGNAFEAVKTGAIKH